LAVLPAEERRSQRFKRIEVMLDRGAGACHLRDSRIAGMVESAFLHFDAERYRFLCWCIMPNHVHTMIETFPAHPLDQIVHTWKSFTSKQANRILKRKGSFWQAEYHDRFIRDDDHYANVFRYIEGNPVKAGLVEKAEDWRWSSAWKDRKREPVSKGTNST
jgi:REP element-mobilizing transposase RayT